MDPESLEKWKLELENDRRDQLTKAKELQKETILRRKYGKIMFFQLYKP